MNECNGIPTLQLIKDAGTNAEVFNEVVTSNATETVKVDSAGNKHKTLANLDNLVDIAGPAADRAEQAANAALAANNYEGPFVPGVTNATKGNSYSYAGSIWACLNDTSDTPSESSSNWYSLNNHSSMTNREDVGAHPVSAIDGAMWYVDTIKDLHGLVGVEGQQVSVASYHGLDDLSGGGVFVWTQGRHNGGTFIDTNRTFPTDWNNQSQLTAWFSESSSSVSGWGRIYDNTVSAYDFGAKRDGSTDDSNAVTAASKFSQFGKYDGVADVIIVYGQSNAVGFAGQPGVPAVDNYATPTRKVGTWNYDPVTSVIVPISNTMNHLNYADEGTPSRGNAWTAFANEWVTKTGRQCVIVNAARGGKSIAQLSKGAGAGATNYYQVLLNGYSSTVAAMQNAGLTVGDTHLVFHQGETDMSIGTPPETYKNALRSLFTNLKNDIPTLSKIGVIIVGCPQSRNQYDWQRIQKAQYLAVESNENTSIIYTGCPSFELYTGQYNVADQTHYSQRGYNQMGKGSARGLLEWVNSGNTAESPEKLRTQASIQGSGFGAMQLACATARIQAGSASLLRRSNTPNTDSYYPSYVDLILTDVVDDDCMVFRFAGLAPVMYSMNVEVSEELTRAGVYAVANRYQSGAVYGIKVKFFADLSFLVNVNSGALLAKAPPTINNVINSVISTTVGGGTATLTHPPLNNLPSATYYSMSDMVTAEVALRSDSTTQTRVKTVGTSGQVHVRMDKVPLTRAQAFMYDFTINVSAVVSATHFTQAPV